MCSSGDPDDLLTGEDAGRNQHLETSGIFGLTENLLEEGEESPLIFEFRLLNSTPPVY